MKGSEAKLVSYMQGSDKRFIIPVYQRNYDWKQENCKQLFDDLVRIVRTGRKSHFFGSLVSVHNDGDFNEFLIIDGQQRLTTISLLMLAICDIIKAGIVVPTAGNLAEKIYKTYLIDEWQEDATRIKLKPVKNDSMAFQRLFGNAEEYIPESNLTINYQYFYNRIQKEEVTLDDLYSAITKLEIINITLNQDDNPQLIFESLNSTGLALSEGDKIRNFILMGLPIKEQNQFYEKYWNKIEINTGYDVSSFVRDYLSVKQQLIPSLNKVYVTFKQYVEDEGLQAEPLLSDLLQYSQWYQTLSKGNTADKELNACIYRLCRLETTVTRPFFLEVLRLNKNGVLSLPDVRTIFLFTESFLFRRMICDLPTNALNKIFLTLHREIVRYDGSDADYVEKFKFALLNKTEHGRMPDDEEFVAKFSERPVYQMRSKNKQYLFERLENHGTIEDKDIYRHCDEGVYSIEHIMPQHLTPAWVEALGADYEQIHETWLHRLANLTLTGYNSKYSNNSFEEKRDMDNGFVQSGLRMNTWIAKQDRWTLTELEQRNDLLMKQVLSIWPMPATTYVPATKQLDSYTLDDDVDLSGRDITRFEYHNTEQPVTSWIDMIERVVKMLHEQDNSVLSMLAHTNDSENELNAYVQADPNKLRTALQIDTGIYLERNTSTNTKLSILRKIFKAFGVSPEELTFYLKDMAEDKTEEEAGTRYEVRRKYWAFALNYIQAAHGEKAAFSNVHPSKMNWISGYFGIGGVFITCVANMDSARVELCIGKSSKEVNKQCFDYLLTHKAEIEAKLNNTALTWNRLDDNKSSVISITLPDVSINHDTDWTQMAKFHAEWSKKFYDVIVPLVWQWSTK